MLRLIFLLVLSAGLEGCAIPPPILEQVQQRGELVVATRNSATTYYEGRNGLEGLEYELVTAFAERIGVKVRFVVFDDIGRLLDRVARQKVDMAAAGLTATEGRERRIRFGTGYQRITPQLVYRAGTRRPRSMRDLVGENLEVVAGSSHEEELRRLRDLLPDLSWDAREDIAGEELLHLVYQGLVDYAVADSNEVALNRRFYPELQVAFDLTQPQALAWAFPHTQDSSLYDAAAEFLEEMRVSGRLDQLIERYYGYVERLSFVDTRTFKRHAWQRLPQYRAWFERAAAEHGVDWKLLAAIGYQESHWDPEAVSPTGVRGIMMLTRATSDLWNVADRTDPEQSIMAGGRHLRYLLDRIPDRIPEPDRTWLALAAYNAGFGHLEDARILTDRASADPDKWSEVKKRLPLLSQARYHRTVPHGYARGREPVVYVDNVRKYYDQLSWLIDQQEAPAPPKAGKGYPLRINPTLP